jgi:hypothetical protein
VLSMLRCLELLTALSRELLISRFHCISLAVAFPFSLINPLYILALAHHSADSRASSLACEGKDPQHQLLKHEDSWLIPVIHGSEDWLQVLAFLPFLIPPVHLCPLVYDPRPIILLHLF